MRFLHGLFLFHRFGFQDRFIGVVVEAGVVNLAPLAVGPHGGRGRGYSNRHGRISGQERRM